MANLHLTLAVAPWLVLLPIVARQRLGGTSAYALLLILFAGGALAGGLVASHWRPQRPGLVSLLLLVQFTGVLLSLALPAPLFVVALTHLVSGFGLQVFGVFSDTAIQRSVPPDLLARVMALDSLGSLALVPVGLALTGAAVSFVGEEPVLLFAASTMVALTLLPLAVPGVIRFHTPTAASSATPGLAPADAQ